MNLNRDYCLTVDVRTGIVRLLDELKFLVSDKNTSNIYIKLTRDNKNLNIKGYETELRVITPNDLNYKVKADIYDEDAGIILVNLPNVLTNVLGLYAAELLIKKDEEITTTDNFGYVVKSSIKYQMESVENK